MSGPITRTELDALADRVTGYAERLVVVETKAGGFETAISENRGEIAAQGDALSELNNALNSATGTFERGVQRMEEAETARVSDLQGRVQDAQTYRDAWRSFLTPRNLVATIAALVVLGSLVTAILQGRADTSEVIQALHDLEALEAAVVPIQAPVPEDAP